MSDIKTLQVSINDVFCDLFGTTPLRARLRDIENECQELLRFTDIKNLWEETGDLLCSLLQLCNEVGWQGDDVIFASLEKIKRRKLQYRSLGRKYRAAILGGAFDPIHFGHVAIGQLVLQVTNQDEILFTPCYRHLGGKRLTDEMHRLNMLKLACQSDLRLKPFDYEIRYQFAGETYHFIRFLNDDVDFDNYQFSYIIGQDNADTFDTWYNYGDLEKMIPFIVAPRSGYNRKEQNKWYLKPPHIYIENEERLPDISSTMIRERIKRGESVEGLLHPEVIQYIRDNRLYRE